MRSRRWLFGLIVLVAAFAVPQNPVKAQADRECAEGRYAEIRYFVANVRSQQLRVARSGETIVTLQFEPGALIGVCYERLGPRGEMIGDVVIRASRGARSNPADQTNSLGGFPVVLRLDDVEVTR